MTKLTILHRVNLVQKYGMKWDIGFTTEQVI